MSLKDSIDQSRMNWDGVCLQMEPDFPNSIYKALEKSYPINIWEEKEFYFGGAHGVVAGEEAEGDARRGGSGIVI